MQERLGDGDPKKVFSDRAQHPFMEARDGRKIPIHTVRIRKYETTIALGRGMNERRVITGSNHHVEVVESKDAKGRLKWEGRMVTTYEAMQRLKRCVPVVDRTVADGERFIFSLAGGDTIQRDKVGQDSLFVVRTISKIRQGEREYINISFVRMTDARLKKEIIKTDHWYTALLDPIRKVHCLKVIVTPLGDIRYAND